VGIKLIGANGKIERGVTDKDGYIRFSSLEKQVYQVLIDSELSQVDSSKRLVNLEEDSITTEIGLGTMRNVVLRTVDYNVQKTVVSNISYDISCPSVNYNRKISSVGSPSVMVSIPFVNDCFVGIDPI